MIKKTLAAFFITVLVFATQSFAAFHNLFLEQNQKDISYFVLPHLSGGTTASSINFDYSPEKDRSAEIFIMGLNSLLGFSPNSVTQIGLLGKQKLLTGGSFFFSGIIGMGGLYTPQSGFGMAGNLGGALGYAVTPGIKISIPVVASIFKDGGLIDYSAGLSLSIPGQGNKEIVVGAKGTAMIVLTSSLAALQNSLFGLAGFRAYF
ncbi:hypothetical protein HZC34_03440 [Candidatus Saganbacteria bacterium]|nr:hypothetical protein [Candidatus Saganbacteria bacterium]